MFHVGILRCFIGEEPYFAWGHLLMLGQSIKDIYFSFNRWLVLPSTLLARLRFSSASDLKIHLGCGDDYIDGLLNVDGNIMRKKDLWLDLRNPLPFRSGSVQLIYCSHTLEHLFPEEALRLLKEMARVLSSRGVVRLAVPSLEFTLRILQGEKSKPWPRKFESKGGQAINYLFCDGQHKYGYCFESLEEMARAAGFARVEDCSKEHADRKKDYFGVKLGHEPEGSLIVELSIE